MSCDDLEEFVQADAAVTLPSGLNLQLDSLALSLYEQSYLPLMHRLLQLQPSMDLSHLHRLSVLTAGSGHLSERIEATKEILKLNSNSLQHLVLNVCPGRQVLIIEFLCCLLKPYPQNRCPTSSTSSSFSPFG